MALRLVTQEEIDELLDLATRLDYKGLGEESRRLKDLLGRLASEPDAVPASTAAAILAVTPQTVRNWVRVGILSGYRDNTGHFYARLMDLEPAIRMRRAQQPPPPRRITQADIDAEIAAVRATRRGRAASDS